MEVENDILFGSSRTDPKWAEEVKPAQGEWSKQIKRNDQMGKRKGRGKRSSRMTNEFYLSGEGDKGTKKTSVAKFYGYKL